MRDYESEIRAHLEYWNEVIEKMDLVYELGALRVYDTGPNWVIWGGMAQAHFPKNWQEVETELHSEPERLLWHYLGRIEAISRRYSPGAE